MEKTRQAAATVDKHLPSVPSIPAFVQVVEVGNPAPVSLLEFRHARSAIDRDPRIATRARQRNINVRVGPLGHIRHRPNRKAIRQPHSHGARQRMLALCLLRRQSASQRRRQRRLLLPDHRSGVNLRCVIQSHTGDGEEKHPAEADTRAHPVPQSDLANPERTPRCSSSWRIHHGGRHCYSSAHILIRL